MKEVSAKIIKYNDSAASWALKNLQLNYLHETSRFPFQTAAVAQIY
jgi:hypothetical protein